MALTSANIETRARKLTLRNNTTELTTGEITGYMQEVVRDISTRLLNLKDNSTGTLSADDNTITAPTDMVEAEAAIDEFYLDSHLLDPITFAEWRAGNVRGYAYYEGTIYVSPTPDTDRTYTLYYSKYHSSTVTTISFDDELKMALVYGVCQKIYEDLGMEGKAVPMQVKYEFEIAKFAPADMVAVNIRHDSRE